MTEVSAIAGAAATKVTIDVAYGVPGVVVGVFHCIHESRRLEERSRPTLGFGL